MNIEIKNLAISFNEKQILKSISLSINEGDFLSIIGPNGAGKSTLLKCICGLQNSWSGEILLGDKMVQKYSAKERAKVLSYVPQSIQNSLPFSVYDFVAMGLYPHLSPFSILRSNEHAQIKNALESVNMLQFRDRKMDTLSGGERQMVMIAAALVQGGKTLILDEPISFLDYKHQVEVMQILQRLNKEQSLTIITVNHDLHSALNFSTKIVAIKNGKIFKAGKPADFQNEAVLNEIYETPFRKLTANNQTLILPEGLLS